jgi:hypothetical protein
MRETTRAMTRVARVMAMATTRAIATNSDNMGFPIKKSLAFEDG